MASAPHKETPRGRLARDFRPADLLFDLRIRKEGDNPTGEGALLVEHIHDLAAVEKRAAPLTGPKPSFRRWLFLSSSSPKRSRAD